MVTDVLNYFAGPFDIVGQFTFFHVCAKEIAQYAPEIFMPGVRQETPAVCKHAYKRLNSPIFDKVFNWSVIPSFWSRNHQADPHWILPGKEPSLKFPVMVAMSALSAGFRLYRIVLASLSELSMRFRNRDQNGPSCLETFQCLPLAEIAYTVPARIRP